MRIPRRTRLAVALLAPVFVLAAAPFAIADDHSGNDQGSTYQDTRDHSGRNGAYSEQVRSCTDSDGNVYYQRTIRHADRNGVSTHRTRSSEGYSTCMADNGGGDNNSGSDSGRGDGSPDRSQRGDGNGTRIGGDRSLIDVSVGDVSVLNNGVGGR